ncbi:MAG: hypothetical protein HY298_21100 [Verrucomicrobia bacterium]|nr:hypothetical protein [Verrucomicrobiota bacterium]
MIDSINSRKYRPAWRGGSLGILAGVLALQIASATERYFTYSYEPETMPEGAMEFEQWVTLRTQRTKTVGQDNYNRWDIREELEYGVTDNYTVSLYLNTKAESFRDPTTATDHSSFRFDGISVENRYLVLNPAEHWVGLALYLEPRFASDEAELEQKIILGQRHGDWKWALNLTHATEWEDNFHATEGEVEVTFGIARHLNKRWAVGLEVRDHNEIPEYRKWENTALFVGPVVSYRQEKWWAALTVMPQVYGRNFQGNPDGNRSLELEGHERVNVRLMLGFDL